MISVSDAFKEAMKDRSDYRCSATITLANGTVLALTENDFSIMGNKVSEGAESDGLPLGEAISRSISLELLNFDGTLSAYSFTGAKIELHLLFALDGGTEDVLMGTFTVLTPETPGTIISITANDDMYLTDKDYDTALSYPATLSEIFVDVCNRCGLAHGSDSFVNSDFEVTAKPDGYTYRKVLGMVAMLAGGNARINRAGELEIITYSFASPAVQTVEDWIKLTVATDDITITGISAIASQVVDGKIVRNRVISGADGYVIELENPLMDGKEAEAVSALNGIFVGKTLRRFDGEIGGYPLAEFMDTISVKDRNGTEYFSVVTDMSFTFLGMTSIKNSAASEMRVNSTFDVSKDVGKLIDNERTERITQITKTEEGLRFDVAQLSQQVAMTMTADQVRIAISESVGDINSVTTETGYTFDKDGLRIKKSGEEIENLLDNTGMYVNRDDENILTANNEGVSAINVSVRKYLIIGKNSRLEDYDGTRTACFWIGGT